MKRSIAYSKLKTLDVSCAESSFAEDSLEIASKNEALSITLQSNDSIPSFTGLSTSNLLPDFQTSEHGYCCLYLKITVSQLLENVLKLVHHKYFRNMRNPSHGNLEYIEPSRCNALNISLHSNDSIHLYDNVKLQTSSPSKNSRQIQIILYICIMYL